MVRSYVEAGSVRWFNTLSCFPYSPTLADAAIASAVSDGLALLANALGPDHNTTTVLTKLAGLALDLIRPFSAVPALKECDGSPSEQPQAPFVRTGARGADLPVSKAVQRDDLLPNVCAQFSC